MTLTRNSIRLTVLCLTVGLVAIGCNQAPTTSDTAASQSNQTLTSAAGGDCCAAETCSKCDQAEELVSKATGECGDCAACAQGDSASCKCGETNESVSKKSGDCGDCTACADGDSANCKCGEGTQVEQSETTNADEPAADKTSEATPAGSGSNFTHDRDVFHFLLANHDKITRQVTETAIGVETLTESDDPEIVAKLQEHVASMYQRVENIQPIRMRDPLYREVFKHADQIEMKLEKTEKGIRVTETSEDEYVVKLIQAHAKVVSGFAEHGFAEARKNHEPPRQ